MEDFDDLADYNDDTVHNMWVDFTYHVNTDELDDEFDDPDPDFILND